MNDQAMTISAPHDQTAFTQFAERELLEIRNRSASLMANVSMLGDFSTRAVVELEHVAALFRIDAEALERRAAEIKAKELHHAAA